MRSYIVARIAGAAGAPRRAGGAGRTGGVGLTRPGSGGGKPRRGGGPVALGEVIPRRFDVLAHAGQRDAAGGLGGRTAGGLGGGFGGGLGGRPSGLSVPSRVLFIGQTQNIQHLGCVGVQ